MNHLWLFLLLISALSHVVIVWHRHIPTAIMALRHVKIAVITDGISFSQLAEAGKALPILRGTGRKTNELHEVLHKVLPISAKKHRTYSLSRRFNQSRRAAKPSRFDRTPSSNSKGRNHAFSCFRVIMMSMSPMPGPIKETQASGGRDHIRRICPVLRYVRV